MWFSYLVHPIPNRCCEDWELRLKKWESAKQASIFSISFFNLQVFLFLSSLKFLFLVLLWPLQSKSHHITPRPNPSTFFEFERSSRNENVQFRFWLKTEMGIGNDFLNSPLHMSRFFCNRFFLFFSSSLSGLLTSLLSGSICNIRKIESYFLESHVVCSK